MLSRDLIDVVSLSDLHLDHRANWKVAEAMAMRLIDLAPDVLVLAGDLASTTERVLQVLRFFRPLAGDVIFVPGNHDLWQAPGDGPDGMMTVDTWRLYRQTWPQLCRELGVHYLPERPWVRGEIAVVGTTGWYDYSMASFFARQVFKDQDFRRKAHEAYQWVDRLRTRFVDGERPMEDGEVAHQMEGDLRAQLAGLPPEVESVIGVTHHVPFSETAPRMWLLASGYFSAFMGSVGLGRIFHSDPRVRLVIQGHAHVQRDERVGEIRVVATPLGNPRRDWQGEPADVARERMGVFQV